MGKNPAWWVLFIALLVGCGDSFTSDSSANGGSSNGGSPNGGSPNGGSPSGGDGGKGGKGTGGSPSGGGGPGGSGGTNTGGTGNAPTGGSAGVANGGSAGSKICAGPSPLPNCNQKPTVSDSCDPAGDECCWQTQRYVCDCSTTQWTNPSSGHPCCPVSPAIVETACQTSPLVDCCYGTVSTFAFRCQNGVWKVTATMCG